MLPINIRQKSGELFPNDLEKQKIFCMGAFLLAGGAKGKRFALPHSTIMIHQPSGGAQGQATEIQIVADHIAQTKRTLNELLAANTGQPIEVVERDTDRAVDIQLNIFTRIFCFQEKKL